MTDKIVGIDEVGRGCLAGAVFAAAVILPNTTLPFEFKDSKKHSHQQRETLSKLIKEHAISWAIGKASVEEIDQINILQATLLAMKRAVENLPIAPDQALIDGNQAPELSCTTRTIIRGDETEPCISAASIIAKFARDQKMIHLSKQYPDYGFEQHKGYGTKQHLEAIRILGITPMHRKSFKPVSHHAPLTR